MLNRPEFDWTDRYKDGLQLEFDIAAQDSSPRSRSISPAGSSELNSKTTSFRAYKVLCPFCLTGLIDYGIAGSGRRGLKAPKNCPDTSSSFPCLVSLGLMKVSLGSCHFLLPSGEEDTAVCRSSCVGRFSLFILPPFCRLRLVKLAPFINILLFDLRKARRSPEDTNTPL
jgi:hypothetical protein